MPAHRRPYETKPCAQCGRHYGPRVFTWGRQRGQYHWLRWDRSKLCSRTCAAIWGREKGGKPPRALWERRAIRDKYGYLMVLLPEHPRAPRDSYVRIHRLVAERKIGRFLERTEVVHHVNGRKDDNRPENLLVLPKAIHDKVEAASPN